MATTKQRPDRIRLNVLEPPAGAGEPLMDEAVRDRDEIAVDVRGLDDESAIGMMLSPRSLAPSASAPMKILGLMPTSEDARSASVASVNAFAESKASRPPIRRLCSTCSTRSSTSAAPHNRKRRPFARRSGSDGFELPL